MKVLQITMLLCTFSMYHNSELNDQPTDINISDNKLQMARTKLPIFPKINSKFIMQRQKLINKDNITKYAVTKKPIMTKFVPQIKIEVETSSKIPVTRRPLMKHRAFTMKTFSNHKLYNNDDNQNDTGKKPLSNENAIETDKTSRPKSKIIQDNLLKPKKNISDLIVPTTPVNYYAEESRDRNEYIFLKLENDGKIGTSHDLLQHEDQDYETTTEGNEKLREKRGINIIEEESKPTKYPAWKFNEHDTKVNNDGFYNNVNT